MKKISVCLLLIMFIFFLVGCEKNSIDKKIEEPTEQELREAEKVKLEKYLSDNNYVEIEDNCYKLVVREINDENEKPYNWDITYFYVDTLTINRMTALAPLGINTISTYYYITDSADGSYSYFDSKGNLEKIINYSYDFKNGILNCSDTNCTSYQSTANSEKSTFLNIIKEANVNIELLK